MAIRPAAILPFLKGSRPYTLYVLCVLMLVFTLNQKDRFLLGVTGDAVVKDLHFGDYSCSHENNASSASCDESCTALQTKGKCEERPNCTWDHTPLGLKYELLAGPLFTFIFTMATIPFGLLATSRFINRRVVLAIFLALWSGMTLAAAFTNRYWQFLLARLGLGLFEAVCTPFASSIISDYFQENYRGTALGFYNWGIYLGYSMAFGFNFVLNTHSLGWRWVFIIASLPGFAVALLMLATVREPQRIYQDQSNMISLRGTSLFKKVLHAYLHPALIIMCVAGGIRLGAGLVWAYNVKIYFGQLYCEHVNVGEYLSWVPLVGGTLGALFGGLVSDRLARFSGHKGRMWVLIVSQICAVPFLVGTLYLHPKPWAFLSLIPAYVIGEAWLGICLTVAIELVPIEISPVSISLFLFISNNISSVIPLLLPLLKDYYGLRRAMLILFPGLYVISAALFSVSLCLLIVSDLCKKEGDDVKSKPQGYLREGSKQHRKWRRRKRTRRRLDSSPLLRDTTSSSQDSESSDSNSSDPGDFIEIDEGEQKEAQKALESAGRQGQVRGAGRMGCKVEQGAQRVLRTAERQQQAQAVTRPSSSTPPKQVGRTGRGPVRRAYGSMDTISGGGAVAAAVLNPKRCMSDLEPAGPAPVIGSVSEWSTVSPSVEEKRWLAESQEGI